MAGSQATVSIPSTPAALPLGSSNETKLREALSTPDGRETAKAGSGLNGVKLAQSPDPVTLTADAVAAVVAVIVVTAFIKWWADENKQIIAECSRDIADKLDGMRETLKKFGVEVATPTLQEITRQVTDLFRSTKDQLIQAGKNIWNSPGVVKQMLGDGINKIIQQFLPIPVLPRIPDQPVQPPSRPPNTDYAPPPLQNYDVQALQQNVAAIRANQVLERVAGPVNKINNSIVEFYNRAAGGAAARSNGSLNAPLKDVRDAREALKGILARLDRELPGTSAEFQDSAIASRDSIVKAIKATGTWLANAGAYAKGLSAPGGIQIRNPTIPAVPTWTIGLGTAGNSPEDVARNIGGARASAVSSTRPSPSTNTPYPAVPDTGSTTYVPPADVPYVNTVGQEFATQQAAADKSVIATLSNAHAALAKLNASYTEFYAKAKGGVSARENGSLRGSIQQVRAQKQKLEELVRELYRAVGQASGSVSTTAVKSSDVVGDVVRAAERWLDAADAFAAGKDPLTSGHTDTPELPAPPSYVAAKDPAAANRDLGKRYAAALGNNPTAEQVASKALARGNAALGAVNKAYGDFYANAGRPDSAGRTRGLQGAIDAVEKSAAVLGKTAAASHGGELQSNADSTRNAARDWLASARAYLQGQSDLPKPPEVNVPANSTRTADELRSSMVNNYNVALSMAQERAAAAANKPLSFDVPSGIAGQTSKVNFVSRLPDSVTQKKTVWVNPKTGEVASSERAGTDWFKANVAINLVPVGDGQTVPGSSGEQAGTGAKPPPEVDVEVDASKWDLFRQFILDTVRTAGGPGGGGGDKWIKALVILSAIGTGVGVVSVFQNNNNTNKTDAVIEDNKRQADEANKLQTQLTTPETATSFASIDAKADASVAAWNNYFDQAETLLRANGLADASKPGDNGLLTQFRAMRGEFMKRVEKAALQVKAATTPEAKEAAFKGLLAQSLPSSLRFKIEPDSVVLKGRTSVPNFYFPLLAKALNEDAAGTLTNIANAPLVVKPAAVTAPAAVVTPAPLPTPGANTRAIFGDLNNATPQPQTQTPVGVVQTAPETTPSASKAPIVPTSSTPPRVRPSAPTQSPAAIDPAVATSLKKVNELVAQAGLLNPPRPVESFKDLQFKLQMFVTPGRENNAKALSAAYDKAIALWKKIDAVWKPLEGDAATKPLAQAIKVPNNSLVKVMGEIVELIKAAEAAEAATRRVIELPSPTPSSPNLAPRSPDTVTPLPSPTETPEPAPANP